MIALIGMAGRFPGAPDLQAYWNLLANGREGLTRLCPDELMAAGVTPETLADPRYVPAAAMLDGFDRFDAGFWDIGGHEAALMDPQQRILLELAWHALEDAGLDPRRTDASIGVFVGAAISTYLLFQLRTAIAGPSAPSQLLAMMGNDKDYMATQLAYRLDLKGPAVSVQTACSSSLVAVHMACQSLLSGECDIALAGGVSVRVPHRVGYLHEAGGMLSPDGHCRSYAEDAAGTVFGSGAGLVVLRRAEDAGRDRVRAQLLGSAVNNDGSRKIGFTAPSQDRQAAVIAEAMGVADIRPSEIGYVEGHGTATPLGDPVEVAALVAAYRGAPAASARLGSAKSNIGHTETAAGVAGLIKAVLMLEHGLIVPTLHADRPNSRIGWEATPFRLASEARPWTDRLVAGVSSFGIGGTNAHVVLARAPAAARHAVADRLIVSARDLAALDKLAAACGERIAVDPAAFPAIAGAAARRARLPVWMELGPDGAPRPRSPSGEPAPEVSMTGDGPSVDLPLYPFQRSRHWFASPETLLGKPVPTPWGETLRSLSLPLALLRQHVVAGQALLPAALHLALAAELAAELGRAYADLTVERPFVLEGQPLIQLWQDANGGFRVMAERNDAWHCLASARAAEPASARAAWHDPAPTPAPAPACDRTIATDVPVGRTAAHLETGLITGAAWAAAMAEAGLAFGSAFLPIQELRREPACVWARLQATSPIVILDGGLQALGAAVNGAAVKGAAAGFLPASVDRFAVHGDVLRASTAVARLTEDRADLKRGDVVWLDGTGRVVAEATGVTCRRAADPVGDMLYRLVWQAEDDPALTGPHAALEQAARGFARQALAAVPSPARPAIASLLRPHAVADAGLADPAALCRELAARHPDHAAEIELVSRCGAALAEILAGRRDPLEVLFGDESGTHGAYRNSPLAQRLNAAAASVAASTGARRVIEIGGGTGATTQAVREALAGDVDYLFTDISPGFLAAAERRFPGVRTAALDIGRDPADQGVETAGWDLVVAANVLHAAPDLTVAVRHATRLLAPGGRLLLVEGTEAQARLDITFGLTEGWTRQADRDLRPTHPLVDAATWRRLLRDAGLRDVVTVAALGGQVVLTGVAGPPRWVAVGHDRRLAEALGLPLVALSDLAVQMTHAAAAHPRRPGLEDVAAWASATGGSARVAAPSPEPCGVRSVAAACVVQEGLDGVVSLAGLEEDGGLDDLLALSRVLLAYPDAPRLLVPTADPPTPAQAALGGFLRTLAREHPALRIRSMGVDASDLSPIAVERALDDGEDRVAWRDGRRMLARLERLPGKPPAPQRLAHDLTLADLPRQEPGRGEVRIRVRAAGLNYKDALTAAGQVPPIGPGLGGECAGEVEALGPGVACLTIGDAVVAVAAGALASHVCADARLVLRKPPGLSYAQAAAVPIAGATAWHALHDLARIRPGQRVLIHAATGGVGWFAVRLAQQAGAAIVATAGSPEKRARLQALGVREVFSSRDTEFAAAAPVDVVLGALPPAQRAAALRLLRPGGCYVEIGRGEEAETPPERRDIEWRLVALDRVEAPAFAAILRQVLDAVAADPTLLPPVRTMPLEAAPDAFMAMMRAAHVGKLVALPPHAAAIRADATYLVTGGLGGLGPEIAAWLNRRGAGGVVRLARRAPDTAVPNTAVPDGAVPDGAVPDDVVIGDVADRRALAAVDAHVAARGLPPVRGVLHAAGVLEDGTIGSLDPASFARVAAPKLDGLAAIRAQWPDLALLVGFSSAGALFGSAGQATHTAASAALDAALEQAAAQGYATVAIDWGAWRDAGAARARGIPAALSAGMGSIATRDGFAALERILDAGVAHAAVLPIDPLAMRRAGAMPRILRDVVPRASEVAGMPPGGPTAARVAGSASAPLVAAVSTAPVAAVSTAPVAAVSTAPVAAAGAVSPADRRAWLQERVAAECGSMLAIRGAIETRRPLQELGLDSLSALELRNRLGRLAGVVLPASLLFDYPTVATLTDHLAATHFGLAPEPVTPARPAASDPPEDASEEDLDAVLSAFAARYGDGT